VVRRTIKTRKGEQAEHGSPIDMVQRKELALRLIRAGASTAFIRGELARQLSLSETQASNAHSAAVRDLAESYEADLAATKAMQVERLMNDAVWMRAQRQAGQNGVPTEEYNHHALVQTERLLAQVQGTMAPLKVKVDESAEMRGGLMALVASLSSEEVMDLAEQQEEYERATRH
jgi:hypothetical protein